MDFEDTPQESEFRAEAQSFLQAEAHKVAVEPNESEKDYFDRTRRWQKIKSDDGWACLSWPEEYGGRGLSLTEEIIWKQEEQKYNTPDHVVFAIGLGQCGMIMMAYASAEQKVQMLPKLASGEQVWCQLFSEPSAGSDLANLRSRAVKDGDEWVINGQKTWTSGAQYADWGILITRTDPTVPKHKGLTFFFINMDKPGIRIRPIKQINGEHKFNEVFFSDVRVPDTQRLGSVGDGWKVAMRTLVNERLGVGDGTKGFGQGVAEALALARELDFNGRPAIEDAFVRARLADWYCQESGLKYSYYRVLSALSRGEEPGPETSVAKLVASNKQQNVGALMLDLLDMGGISLDESSPAVPFQKSFMEAPASRIAGGTDEILRNIIAERVLGLPADVRVDKDVPFNEVPQGNT